MTFGADYRAGMGIKMDVQQAIRMMFAHRNVTQRELASRIGMAESNVSRILSKQDFRVNRDLQFMANGLNCDVEVSFIDRSTGKAIASTRDESNGEQQNESSTPVSTIPKERKSAALGSRHVVDTISLLSQLDEKQKDMILLSILLHDAGHTEDQDNSSTSRSSRFTREGSDMLSLSRILRHPLLQTNPPSLKDAIIAINLLENSKSTPESIVERLRHALGDAGLLEDSQEQHEEQMA